MCKTMGKLVAGLCIVTHFCAHIYTALHTPLHTVVGKPSSYPRRFTQVVQAKVHSILDNFISVYGQLIPTVHSLNKDYKNFLYIYFITYNRRPV